MDKQVNELKKSYRSLLYCLSMDLHNNLYNKEQCIRDINLAETKVRHNISTILISCYLSAIHVSQLCIIMNLENISGNCSEGYFDKLKITFISMYHLLSLQHTYLIYIFSFVICQTILIFFVGILVNYQNFNVIYLVTCPSVFLSYLHLT